MAKIYTKVGDKGQTSLVGGQKIAKTDARLEAYGTVDELNSVLGFARAAMGASPLSSLNEDLGVLQHWLFDLGSLLASVPADRDKFKLAPLTLAQIQWMEKKIDEATEKLSPLKNFILPGGSEPAARLQIARAVARRAERAMVAIESDLPENGIPFINRLSDYLFVMARYCNHVLKVEDVVWQKTLPPK